MRRVGSRRTVGLDAELVESLKEVAKKRGVTLSNYLRALINEALALENLGHYAPRALREKRIEYILENLGFILVPKEILGNTSPQEVEEVGKRVGVVAKELGVESLELIELLSRSVGNVIMDSSRIVLIKTPGSRETALVDLIKGISASAGLKMESSDAMVVIEVPKEAVEASLSEFRERKSRRRIPRALSK